MLKETMHSTVRNYAIAFFDEGIASTEEERCEKAAYFVKSICTFIACDDVVTEVFGSRSWTGYKAVDIVDDAGNLRDYLCEKDARLLYKELRNLLMVFLVTFIKESRARNSGRYDLESYLKGMLLDTIGRLSTLKAPAIAYRVKSTLYDAINYSFKRETI